MEEITRHYTIIKVGHLYVKEFTPKMDTIMDTINCEMMYSFTREINKAHTFSQNIYNEAEISKVLKETGGKRVVLKMEWKVTDYE